MTRGMNIGVWAVGAAMALALGVSPALAQDKLVHHEIDREANAVIRVFKTKAGDRIEFVLPMKVQRVRASEKIAADQGRVALRFGPLVYNIEKVDQDITKALAPTSSLSSEWDANLLGGVVVIKGTFADGTPLMAIPNYARYNRNPPPPPAPPPPAPAPGAAPARPPRPPATSIVWISER